MNPQSFTRGGGDTCRAALNPSRIAEFSRVAPPLARFDVRT
jgi:hypothetical protein